MLSVRSPGWQEDARGEVAQTCVFAGLRLSSPELEKSRRLSHFRESVLPGYEYELWAQQGDPLRAGALFLEAGRKLFRHELFNRSRRGVLGRAGLKRRHMAGVQRA